MSPIALAFVLLAGPAAKGSPGPTVPVASVEASASSPGYRIGPEDMLQIAVWNNEPMSRTIPVRPDGKISLPLLNDVTAAGLTPMELREHLMQRLAEYMPTPEVSVIVTDVHSFKVSVIGQVPKPDRFEVKGSATVMDALAMAGGFTEYASKSRVVVIRSAGGRTERLPFDFDKMREGDPRQENFRLQPGDIVVVP